MRLLDTETLKLHEFFGSDIPPYYILSHRWEADEITYQDVRDNTNSKAYGWAKVRNACAFARVRDLECRGLKGPGQETIYIWIDTCCIDKTSSAELSEAINSMFTWYQRADECLVYLKDVPSGLGPLDRDEAMLKSEWFQRGWTLQELLAPVRLVFVCSDWDEVLGPRLHFSEIIFEATGIENEDFSGLREGSVSVARRMSWASCRTCTREEDEAYCLMGLFGVNMPLLYGEGRKAFNRLQKEILKESDDESIFAWWTSLESHSGPDTGLLANSPSDFKFSSWVYPFPIDRLAQPYSMTNKGLQLEVSLLEVFELNIAENYCVGIDGTMVMRNPLQTRFLRSEESLTAVALNCYLKKSPLGYTVGIIRQVAMPDPILIILRLISDSSNTYHRTRVDEVEMTRPALKEQSSRQTIFVKAPAAGQRRGKTSWTPGRKAQPRLKERGERPQKMEISDEDSPSASKGVKKSRYKFYGKGDSRLTAKTTRRETARASKKREVTPTPVVGVMEVDIVAP